MKFSRLNSNHMESLRQMVGEGSFSTGDSTLSLHSRDQSFHPASLPEAVMWPGSRKEVSDILRYADAHRIPVTAWGSGTSMEGNPIPVKGGLVLDFSKMNRILKIREEDFQADVEPGVIYQDLNIRLKSKGLFFPPDPGARATIGGMIANNASGPHTVRYGSTKDFILKLNLVLASGEEIEAGTRASKSSSGYDLVRLFVGSEGTLGVVVEATVRLAGFPSECSAVIVPFPSVESAGKAVYEIIRSGLDPAALEFMDSDCILLINRERKTCLEVLPTLFMEFHGPSKHQLEEILGLVKEISSDAGAGEFISGLGRAERDQIFQARHELGEMIIRNHPGCRILVVDVAVPVTAYPEMISTAKEEIKKEGLTGYIFSHAGDGNLHVNLVGKTSESSDWRRIDNVVDRMISRALEVGGTATGEHGVGIGKRKYMKAEHGNGLEWMKRIKMLFDPNGILNPGKIFS
ncbi:MAG: FAD-binding oxidoreductase [Thermodesulfobacteriota bacterium]